MSTTQSVAMLSRQSFAASIDMPARRMPVKDVGETVTVVFDFSPAAGYVLSPSVSVYVDREAVTDLDPGAILVGAPVISSTRPGRVSMLVSGGLAGNDYGLRCLVTDDVGETLVLVGILPVRRLGSTVGAGVAIVNWNDLAMWDDGGMWLDGVSTATTSWSDLKTWTDSSTWTEQ